MGHPQRGFQGKDLKGWAEVLRKGRVWRCPMLWDLCPWVSKLRGPEGGGSHVGGIFRMWGSQNVGVGVLR